MFKVLAEGEITFLPTSKFELGTNNYDSSRKCIPSYDSRILYVNNPKNLRLQSYQSVKNINFSSHKPLSAVFEVRTRVAMSDEMKLQSEYFELMRHNTIRSNEGLTRSTDSA